MARLRHAEIVRSAERIRRDLSVCGVYVEQDSDLAWRLRRSVNA